MDSRRAIGIFDSGIGGLTVLHSIMGHLPFEDTVYVGDTARVPYGTKSARAVTQYSLEIAHFLEGMNVKALVVACNTASAVALDPLKRDFSIPVLGMVEPAARKAVGLSKKGRIGLIGTEGTVRSGAYIDAVKRLAPRCEVISKACPLFVPLAEEGWVDNEVALKTAETYLSEFHDNGVDTLILGCTHYPLLKETIGKIVGDQVTLVDSGDEAAAELKTLLGERGELNCSGTPSHRYYVTDTPDRFLRLGERFLGNKVGHVNHVDIP